MSRITGAAISVVGVVVLMGWQFDLELLKRMLPSLVAMNPATAVAFVFAGVALWLLSSAGRSPFYRRMAFGLAAVVTLIGLAKVLGYLGGWDAFIDRLLFTDRLADGGPVTDDGAIVPNRMAPNTATLFTLAGGALVMMSLPSRRARIAGKLAALVVALLALVAVIGYLSNVTSLYRPTAYIPIALHTAGAFLALGAGVLTLGVKHDSDPALDRRLIRLVENNITTGFVAALFLVAVIGIVAYASIRDFGSSSRLNEHTRDVITGVAELASHLKDVDAGARGFVITGDASFLQPYHAARAKVSPAFTQLGNLTADNNEQQRQMAELLALTERMLSFHQQVIDTRREEGFAAAQQMIVAGRGEQMMDGTRVMLNEMQTRERSLLKIRSESTADSATVAVGVITIGSLLALGLVVGSGWLIRKDIVMRQATEAELRRTRDAAEAANHAKSQFLANMSHEIRTPMTAIIGYADLLLDPRQNDSDRLNYLNTIRRNGEHLLTLINDILDLSKIEAGKAAVERVTCSPCRIISDVASLMRVRATEKNLLFEVVSQTPLPATIQTDPTRLRQVLINLIGNAIKFTDAGWVRLHVQVEPDDTGRELLRFDVIDTGIGMTRDQIDKLFQPFAQADCSTTRRFGGTGLGLSICKPLAEKLGGRIAIDATPDRGSTFSVWIDPGPLENVARVDACIESVETDHPNEQDAPLPTLRGRILLVDDGLDNRQLLSVYLRQAGAEVALAENGQTGAEKALAALGDDKPYDLVLMDMQMPVLDGYAATARLRARGYERPIIALTAHAMAEDRIKCLNAGCTDYLTKPIRRRPLLEALAEYLGDAPAVTAENEGPRVAAADDKRAAPPPAGSLCPEVLDESIQPFIDAFIRSLPGQATQLQAMLVQNDTDQLAELVHKLKGTGGLYGLMPITDMATDAEACLHEGASLEIIASQVDALVAMMRRVEGYDRTREIMPDDKKGTHATWDE
ncbi:MAG: CHASE3 domain-containing protein [Phycisphaeraceae bacterium]